MENEVVEKVVVKLTVSGILQDLKDGLTREDIAKKYDLTKSAVKNLFTHPKLKNKKTIKQKEPEFELIDDTEEDGQAAEESKQEEKDANQDFDETPFA